MLTCRILFVEPPPWQYDGSMADQKEKWGDWVDPVMGVTLLLIGWVVTVAIAGLVL